MVDKAELARALRGAVERGEVSAWFQPQVDLRTDRVVAAEALCRWHHAEWGQIGPNEFIPIAEEQGVIGEIGKYMTEQAVALMKEAAIDVSVNVSPTQLEDSAFTNWLERLLRRMPESAPRLTVEITEGRPVDDAPAVVTRLNRLRALGVGVAIDDFGVGQASLTQLKRLHATELKLDRTLIVDDSPSSWRVLTAATTVARRSGIRVVAEGVETIDQLDKVTRLKCDRAQGYLLGRPVPAPEMRKILQTA